MTTKGSCMCGAIQVQYTGEPATRGLCHCVDCQKWSGGAFTSNVLIPDGAFTVNKGTPKSYDVVGDSGKINKHSFCGDCGSSLFTQLEVVPDMVVIKAGILDDGAAELGGKPAFEFYTKRRVPYVNPCDGATQSVAMESPEN